MTPHKIAYITISFELPKFFCEFDENWKAVPIPLRERVLLMLEQYGLDLSNVTFIEEFGNHQVRVFASRS